MADRLPGVVPSPNIWQHPKTYEIENRCLDPDRLIEQTMLRLHPLHASTVLDVGCGSGFHLPWFAQSAAQVVGVEPPLPLLALARRRVRNLGPPARERIVVRQGTAQRLPVADASVDVAHARWAYFFGPGCEPGLAELTRVIRRGGTAFVIDNDATRSTFGRWFSAALPSHDPVAVERFWGRHGFTREPLSIRLAMASRADFEDVVRIEFAPDLAERVLGEHAGHDVDYAVNLWWRHY